MNFTEVSRQRDREIKRRRVEHKPRDIGFAWGTLAVGVPFMALILVSHCFNVEWGEELQEKHWWVTPLVVGGFAVWIKFAKWMGVGRHDPKRMQADHE